MDFSPEFEKALQFVEELGYNRKTVKWVTIDSTGIEVTYTDMTENGVMLIEDKQDRNGNHTIESNYV